MGGESAAAAFVIMNRSLSKKGWCLVVLIMTLFAPMAMGHSDMDSCKSDVSIATENVLQHLKVSILGMGGPKMWTTDLCYMCFVVVDAHNLQRKLRMTLFLFCRRSSGVQSTIRSSQIVGVYLLTSAQIFFSYHKTLRPPSSNYNRSWGII